MLFYELLIYHILIWMNDFDVPQPTFFFYSSAGLSGKLNVWFMLQ